jgi:5'-nucleotidase
MMKKMTDPWNRDIYWYGSLGKELDAGEGTDFDAVMNGYASITPLTVDMTAHKSISQMTDWVDDLSL